MIVVSEERGKGGATEDVPDAGAEAATKPRRMTDGEGRPGSGYGTAQWRPCWSFAWP